MSNNIRVSATSMSPHASEPKQPRFTLHAGQWLWIYCGILEALVALRVGLKIIGANPDNPLIAWIYGFTALLLVPTFGLVGAPAPRSIGLELATIMAIVIFALIVAWAIKLIVWLIFYRSRGPGSAPLNPRPATRILPHSDDKNDSELS